MKTNSNSINCRLFLQRAGTAALTLSVLPTDAVPVSSPSTRRRASLTLLPSTFLTNPGHRRAWLWLCGTLTIAELEGPGVITHLWANEQPQEH